VLLEHSPDDGVIGYRHGEAIFAAAIQSRCLLTIRRSYINALVRDERPGVVASARRPSPVRYAPNNHRGITYATE
jgi:hypothetical protein